LAARKLTEYDGHDVTCTPNHWTTVDSHKRCVENVIIKDYKKTCDASPELVKGEQAAILIMDFFSVRIFGLKRGTSPMPHCDLKRAYATCYHAQCII
jgi:hypothetical protein